jgi:N-acyl-D-aspartate/D-glutamate deacylase
MKKKVDILIRGGLIYDGRGGEPFIADIGVTGDRITYRGPSRGADAETIIDAEGLAVAPGFIDTHSHSDFTIVADPRAEGKLYQGITTEVDGNCGMSAAPLFQKAFEKREEDLRELGIAERWRTLKEYFEVVGTRGLGVNIAMLAGHGNIRGSVVGYDDRRPSGEDLSKMSGLLRDALRDGAIGLSTGLIYPPGIYSDTEELLALAGVLRDADLIYTSHMRSEGATLEAAVEEVIRIGRDAGTKVHISHIKTAGPGNWHKAENIISKLHESRNAGIRITCDRYPYTASSTDLDSLLPSWAFAGGNDEELMRLRDSTERARIAGALEKQAAAKDYWEKIIVSSVASERNRWMEGRTIAEIGGRLRKCGIDAVLDLLVEERLRVGAIFFSMSEENLRRFLSLPFCMIGTDSSARCFDGPTRQGKPHPRGFGTFPRLLGIYVRGEGLMPLEEAIRRATMLAAETFGLEKRGELREHHYADLVVFDPAKVVDHATFEDPFRQPDGFHHVIVNGVLALREGRATGSLSGRVLRGGKG